MTEAEKRALAQGVDLDKDEERPVEAIVEVPDGGRIDPPGI